MSYDPSITFFASFIPMFFSFASLIELAFYIIGSIGLYSMANNTGMKTHGLHGFLLPGNIFSVLLQTDITALPARKRLLLLSG